MDFLKEKISRYLDELNKYMYSSQTPLDEWKIKYCGYKPSGDMLPEVDDTWENFPKGGRWGKGPDSHCWFYGKFTVPEELAQRDNKFYFNVDRPEKWFDSNPQFTVYVNGKIAHGMDHNHRFVDLPGSGEYEVYVYAYTGVWAGEHGLYAGIITVDTDIQRLYYNLKVPRDCLNVMRENTNEYVDILRKIDEGMNLVRFTVPGSEEFYDSVRAANKFLEEEFYGKVCHDDGTACVCIGHTHIDVAWLWTLAQTREKSVRSFSNVVDMMEHYPEYKFMSSQPQLYKYVKEDSPETYEKIKKFVAEGRWEPEGAMWVEADCNLPSGESLVRQLMFGKRFFRDEFGKDNHILWLPDVFGYSAALPQILKLGGVDTFVTSKISWNEYNCMPYDSFWWHGIDGTDIFTWFMTAQDAAKDGSIHTTATYTAHINPSQVKGAWNRYQQKHIFKEVMLTYGEGDGGGGPTPEHIETHRRLKHGIPSFPKTKLEFAGDFLARAKAACEKDEKTPHWHGELYLEFHRGTYTSNAKNKRYNRKSEFLYQNTELYSEISRLLLGSAYPQAKLNEGWETILLNQFHDIIPGSSIAPVYAESEQQYIALMESANDMLADACSGLKRKIDTEGGILVFNPLSFTHSGTVRYGDEMINVKDIPAKGWKVIKKGEEGGKIVLGDRRMENDCYIVEFAPDWTISRIYDKRACREVLTEGQRGNVIEVYEDLPREYDAWELTCYYREKMEEMSDVSAVEEIDEGARKGFKITRKFYSSTVEQKVFLYDKGDRIDFVTHADWHEAHLIVKAAFPVDINSTRATYEIQFGSVERPTHSNTSWDKAKFEVCAHKFADISEYGYGVSILNDCKYGHDIHEGVMRLTLLKCATHPSPVADKCEHDFTYALRPHPGSFESAGTVEEAYDLNNPMQACPISAQKGTLPEEFSLVCCDKSNVVVDTVKKAEDTSDTIVRMYESLNMHTDARLTFGVPFKKAYICGLMENEIEEIPVTDVGVDLKLKPYEIVTLKLKT